jgi:hypothetical protein
MNTLLDLLLTITGLRAILGVLLIGMPALAALVVVGVIAAVALGRDVRHPLASPHRR